LYDAILTAAGKADCHKNVIVIVTNRGKTPAKR
jgi:hypothetical protein